MAVESFKSDKLFHYLTITFFRKTQSYTWKFVKTDILNVFKGWFYQPRPIVVGIWLNRAIMVAPKLVKIQDICVQRQAWFSDSIFISSSIFSDITDEAGMWSVNDWSLSFLRCLPTSSCWFRFFSSSVTLLWTASRQLLRSSSSSFKVAGLKRQLNMD